MITKFEKSVDAQLMSISRFMECFDRRMGLALDSSAVNHSIRELFEARIGFPILPNVGVEARITATGPTPSEYAVFREVIKTTSYFRDVVWCANKLCLREAYIEWTFKT